MFWAHFYISNIRTGYVNPLEGSATLYQVACIGDRVLAEEGAKTRRRARRRGGSIG